MQLYILWKFLLKTDFKYQQFSLTYACLFIEILIFCSFQWKKKTPDIDVSFTKSSMIWSGQCFQYEFSMAYMV
jgi:hypothetical protein